MPLQDFLTPDETILASARASLQANLYATNKRVIRYQKGFRKEKVDSLYYPHIVGASYESYSYYWLIAFGIGIIIFGALLGFIHWFLVMAFVLIGVLIVVAGVFARPRAWYQIKGVGLTQAELLLWRTDDAEADARAFASFIQGQISVREMPPPPPPAMEREVITREVVMIKCKYCGGLMLQTSTFCPNCGARRQE